MKTNGNFFKYNHTPQGIKQTSSGLGKIQQVVAQANLNADLVFPPPSTYADPHALARRNLPQTQLLGPSQTTFNVVTGNGSGSGSGIGTMLHQLQNQRRSVGMIEVLPDQQPYHPPSDKMSTKAPAKGHQ